MSLQRFSIPSVLVALALAGACGEEEVIQRLQPSIYVCAKEDAPKEECNASFDVGDAALTVAKPVTLYVTDRGQGLLTVSNVTSSDGLVTPKQSAFTVAPGGAAALVLDLAPTALGPGTTSVVFASDDPMKPMLTIELRYTGVPKPVPNIELCLVDAAEETCGTDLMIDFGLVRRAQQESRSVIVRNTGTAPLSILEVKTEGMTSVDGELTVATSTRPGMLPIGAEAPAVLVYEPADGTADAIQVVFSSDDPDTPEARLHLSGTSEDNFPPIADARQYGTGSTDIDAAVDDAIVLDGTASTDPEGDTLAFQWTMEPPARSIATIDDPTAERVSFTPDVAGTYRVTLQVFDSLGQASNVEAVVLIQAMPRYALRASIDWSSGGDVDIHLVRSGDQLFSAGDCYFGNRAPDFGMGGVTGDDPRLAEDAVSSPGRESIVIEAPPDGTYAVYAQYYDEASLGAANVSARIIFQDASIPAFQDSRSLPRTCSLWYIGDVTFPDGTFMPSQLGLTEMCP